MTQEGYEYPLMPEWNVEEVLVATDFYLAVESFYQRGVKRSDFLTKYQKFKKMEPAKMIQKQLDKRFQQAAGYSIYQAVQAALKSEAKFISYN